MERRVTFLLLCACVLGGLCAPLVQAQEFKRLEELVAMGVSHHVFARQGEPTIQVLVLGSVGAPGVYEIGTGVELDQLLALSGGMSFESTEGSVTRVTIRLFREGSGQRSLVYEAPMERLLAEPGLYPLLQEGDVLTVEAVTVAGGRFGWRDALSILTSALSMAILFERFL
ncbi:MAG: hypothetical protein R3247_05465 [Rhodothermales bacterium]|nr:hypothetical protein [Rhodothermales bacterium]